MNKKQNLFRSPVTEINYRLFTVHEFEVMIRNQVFNEDERFELIDGAIVTKPIPGILHAACVDRLTKVLARQIADDISISVQNPVATHTHTQPEPDVFLLAPRDDYYTQGRPTPDDVLLLIEVSDSSLHYDQKTKLPLYATAGIREIWIVNLPEQSIDCYSNPTAHGYRLRERFFPGDTIHPNAMPDVTVDVQYILNPMA